MGLSRSDFHYFIIVFYFIFNLLGKGLWLATESLNDKILSTLIMSLCLFNSWDLCFHNPIAI